MKPFGQGLAVAGLSLFALVAAGPASAQKSGGMLKMQHFDSPASMSVLEESTRAALQPMMAVFNNLVIYDQNVKQNSLDASFPISRRLELERGRQGTDLPAARGRQMA